MTGERDTMRSLVTQAQAGDRRALEALLGTVRPHVYRYVLSRLADRGSADDVTQEVAMTIVSALPRYVDRVDQGSPFLSWVFGIAMRKVSEAHRALGRRHDSPVDAVPDQVDAADDPLAVSVRLDTTRRMAALLAQLPHPQGEIVRLRVAAGLSAEETADVLGMTPGAVRVAQHRALAKLRATVGSEALR